jgi:hypothetical protein
MRRVGPNGTYKDNRTLGREYGGQWEVEQYLKACRVPPRNKIPTDGLTDAQLKKIWNRTYDGNSSRCRRGNNADR